MTLRQGQVLLSIIFATACLLRAEDAPRFEAGVQLTIVDSRGFLEEKPLAAGARFTATVWRFLAAEAEFNRLPIGGAVSLYPSTQVLTGVRVGRLFGPVGVFGKVRPGFIRYDQPNLRAPQLRTVGALDAGVILEIYSRRHFAFRMDIGSVAVFYGTHGPGGTRHQMQSSFGLSAWF